MRRRLRGPLLALVLTVTLTTQAVALGGAAAEPCDQGLRAPTGVLAEEGGALLIVDSGRNCVLRLKDGRGELVAGYTLPNDSTGYAAGGLRDGPAELALFDSPFAAVPWRGGIAISDQGNHCIRYVRDGWVVTLTGDGSEGDRNGTAGSARFSAPSGLAVDEDSGALYIADSGNGCVKALSPEGTVSTYVSGLGEPVGLCWRDGALYVTDALRHQILKVEKGEVAMLAGTAWIDEEVPVGGFLDGRVETAEFSYPMGIAVEGDTVYIADTGNSAIRVLQGGWVETVACFAGSEDGLLPASPVGIQLTHGSVYAADSFAGAVLRLDTGRTLFSDVPADVWFGRAVGYAYISGIMAAEPGARFAPDEIVTEGEALAILRSLTETSGLKEDHAAEPETSERPVTREAVIKMLCRGAGGEDDERQPGLEKFLDYAQVDQEARAAMEWAYTCGLLLGSDEGLLLPQEPVTRAQMAVFLTRLLTEEPRTVPR